MSSPIARGGSLPPTAFQDANRSTSDKRVEKVDRSQIDPQLVEAAEGMEAIFIDYMYKTMRESVPKSEMSLDSPATNMYRSMQDSEHAKNAAKAGGIGLADLILAHWKPQEYNQNRALNTPSKYPHPMAPKKSVKGQNDES